MSKRISQKNGTFNPEVAGKHIRAYISENNLTYDKMGWLCGRLNYRTISKIAHGEDNAYDESTFVAIAEKTKIAVAYWTGLTEEKISLEEERLYEQLSNAENKHFKKIRREQAERYKTFFAICGYEYSVDMNDISFDTTEHFLIKNGQRYTFDTDELDELFARLERVIDFTCFEKDTSQ